MGGTGQVKTARCALALQECCRGLVGVLVNRVELSGWEAFESASKQDGARRIEDGQAEVLASSEAKTPERTAF